MGHGPGRGAGWVVSADTWPEWRPGMADINGTRVESILRAEDEWLFTTIGDRYGEDLDPPDTDDPATVGCIHAQAEEAWGCEVRTRRLPVDPVRWVAFAAPITAGELAVAPNVSWGGPTRGEALLACWRAAQERPHAR